MLTMIKSLMLWPAWVGGGWVLCSKSSSAWLSVADFSQQVWCFWECLLALTIAFCYCVFFYSSLPEVFILVFERLLTHCCSQQTCLNIEDTHFTYSSRHTFSNLVNIVTPLFSLASGTPLYQQLWTAGFKKQADGLIRQNLSIDY